jgi:ubiquitin-conjugating enzyme E2 Q
VDLLVSLAYSAAVGGALNDPLPIGLGLRVPAPNGSYDSPPGRMFSSYAPPQHVSPSESALAVIGHDGLCDFDALPIGKVRASQ